MRERSTKRRSASTVGFPAAWRRATPFPARMSGAFAPLMSSAAFAIASSWAFGYEVRRTSSGLASALSDATSSGSSMCVAPGFSSRAMRKAFRTTSGTVFATVTRVLHFVTGPNIRTMSMY